METAPGGGIGERIFCEFCILQDSVSYSENVKGRDPEKMKSSIFSVSGIKELVLRYREILLYLIVGVITTVINGAVYWICTSLLKMANVPGTIVAWVIAVLFAFFANKIWVFESRSMRLALVLKEMVQFVGCRLGTGVLDVGIMYVSVDLWGWNGLLMKLISDFVVTLVNFVASKFFIFKKKV